MSGTARVLGVNTQRTGTNGNEITHLRMTPIIMGLDVIEVGCLFESGDLPVQVFQPTIQIGVVMLCIQISMSLWNLLKRRRNDQKITNPNASEIRLEMAMVDGIKSDESGVESHISFGESVPHNVLLPACEDLLELVERFKEGNDGCFICILSGGKSSFVYAICQGRWDVRGEARLNQIGERYILLTVW